jgi:molybdopterin-guanine dinucleotide biosynthesis protein A
MGRPKALLPFGPELMLQRVVRILSGVVSPIVVVAAPDQTLPPLPRGVLLARDEREGRGPLQGLLAGMKELARRGYSAELAVFATSCDVPLLAPAFISQVLAAMGPLDQAAVPVEDLFYHSLAAAYRLAVLPEIEALLAADQLRPAFLFDRVSTSSIPVELLRAADRELHSLKNCNRPEDYLAALNIAGFPVPESV